MVPHSLGLWGCADWEGLVQVYFKTWSNYNVPKPLGARLDEKGLKPFRVLGSYFRNIFRCRFRRAGVRQRLRLSGEFENETSNCCHLYYKAQVYVAASYVAPPHPTEEVDTRHQHHPPHTTTTGGAGGIPYHPPGGGELLGLQNTPSPWGWGGSSSLQSYIYIYIYKNLRAALCMALILPGSWMPQKE